MFTWIEFIDGLLKKIIDTEEVRNTLYLEWMLELREFKNYGFFKYYTQKRVSLAKITQKICVLILVKIPIIYINMVGKFEILFCGKYFDKFEQNWQNYVAYPKKILSV